MASQLVVRDLLDEVLAAAALPDGEAWHIEHVVPVERGGPTHAENLTLACRCCNLAKGTRPAFRFAVTRSLM